MELLRERYETFKTKGLVYKAEYLLKNLDATLRFNCDECNSNVFDHECLADGTTKEKLEFNRDILTQTSIDTEIDSIIDVALFLTKNSEKLSDIRDEYDFEEMENPDVNFSPQSSPQSLPDIMTIDDSDDNDELSPPNRPSTSNYPLQQKSKFGKLLSSKRGKARQQLFLGIPYCTASKREQSFQSLGQKLIQLNVEYQELLLNVSDTNTRDKQAIELVISKLNQCEDVHTSIQLTHDSDDRLKKEFQEKENKLKLELNETQRAMDYALNCSICLENKKAKSIVPCGHSFCFNCIMKLSKYGKKCAICRKRITRIIPMYC